MCRAVDGGGVRGIASAQPCPPRILHSPLTAASRRPAKRPERFNSCSTCARCTRDEEARMRSSVTLSARECLPSNREGALLVGRAWLPADQGPSVIAVRGDDLVDLTRSYPTVSHLLNAA